MSYVIPSTNLDNSSMKAISELHSPMHMAFGCKFLLQAEEVPGKPGAKVLTTSTDISMLSNKFGIIWKGNNQYPWLSIQMLTG